MTTSTSKSLQKSHASCPTAPVVLQGGDLGWLTSNDCAPEFARELFGHAEVGVLPRLVHSRFGLHVVEVLQREPGIVQPFEVSTRHRDHVAAPENLCDCAAPVPAPAGSTGQCGRCGTGDSWRTVAAISLRSYPAKPSVQFLIEPPGSDARPGSGIDLDLRGETNRLLSVAKSGHSQHTFM